MKSNNPFLINGFKTLLKVAIAFGLIYWLWSSGKLDFSALAYFLTPHWAILGFSLIGLNIFLCNERWRLLLKMQNRSAGRWNSFKLNLIGIFFNYAMPGGVGGDVVKAFYFHKDYPNSKVIALTSVLTDRVMGLYSMILMGLFVMLYDWSHVSTVPQLTNLFYGVALLTVIASLGLYLLFSAKLYNSGLVNRLIQRLPMSARFQKIYDSFHMYGKSPTTLVKVVLYSVVAQVSTIFYLILVGTLSGGEAPWSMSFLVAPLGFIATGIPITPAGIGVGQAAFYFLFNVYMGTITSLGATVITAFQVTQLLWGLIGAFFYLRRKQPIQSDFEETALV
jgi:uncharacterized protein (TIRG00374 family)